jgi:phosphoglycolate phosphatase-like HAD superfamily hydrolase
MPDRFPALIFDLDGTILDSKPGIVRCLAKVLAAHSIEVGDPLERFIGPPIEARSAFVCDYRSCHDIEG